MAKVYLYKKLEKNHICKWTFFGVSNFAVIEEMAYALLLLLGTTVKNSKQFCTAMEKLVICTLSSQNYVYVNIQIKIAHF